MPWNENLSKHQDWDFLINLHRSGMRCVTLADPLVSVYQNSAGSVSRAADWHRSIEWLDGLDAELGSRSRGDFIASVALRGAIAQKDLRASMKLLIRSIRDGCHPAALIVGLSGLARLIR
jgi:hypothetical protein